VLAIAAPLVICVVLFTIVGLPLQRFRTGQWRPRKGNAQGALVVAFVLTVVMVSFLLWVADLPQFTALIVLWGSLLAGTLALALLAANAFATCLSPRGTGRRLAIKSAWVALVAVSILFLAGRTSNFPVPRWPQVQAQAAGSMRATAADLATFHIELSSPKRLSAETARQMRSPQVRLSDDLSWGLGPGIQHSADGDALWQWGQHLHFQSVMIIYPERGFGVVVCTNNDLLNPDVAVEIAHRALGGRMEPIIRATHLQYNYR